MAAPEVTLDDLKQQLADWYGALKALQKGQQYTIGGIRNGRQLVRADLPEARATIDWLEGKIAQKESELAGGTGVRVQRMRP